MAPTSAVMPLPMRPPTMTAVSVGASSRKNDKTTTRGMYSRPPKRFRPNANWMVMTMPMKMLVTLTMPIDCTPRVSIWCSVERISSGRFQSMRSVRPESSVTSPS